MSSYSYHFRPSTRSTKSRGTIFLRVIHSRRSFEISLGLHVFPEEWDPAARTVILPAVSSLRYTTLKTVRDSLDASCLQMERIIAELESNGYYTAADIRDRLRRRRDSGLFSDFVRAVIAEIGRKQERTARAYKSMLTSVLEFTGGEDITLSRINNRFVEAYERHLKEKELKMNTISFYMRNLRAIYNRAARSGLIPYTIENPFGRVFTGVKVTEKKALDAVQISRLVKLDHSLLDFTFRNGSALPRVQRDALALFLFAFFAHGMSFVDLAYLRKENIHGGIIRYRRKKTGQTLEVPICREMKSIIAYFSARTKLSPFIFPLIVPGDKSERLQYESALRIQNIRLKRLGVLSGRTDKLSTHAARHSWATIAKNEKVEIAVISEALGHTSENTTRIYLDSFKKNVLDKVNERIRRAIKKAV